MRIRSRFVQSRLAVAQEWVQVLLFGGWDGGAFSGESWLATGFYSGIWYRTYLPLAVRNH